MSEVTGPTLFPEASFPFPSSSTWKRRFSSRMTDPAAGLAQAFSTSWPTQSFKNKTSLGRAGDGDNWKVLKNQYMLHSISCQESTSSRVWHLLAQQRFKFYSNWLQRVLLRHGDTIWPAKMAHKNNWLSSIVQAEFDAWDGSLDSATRKRQGIDQGYS